VHKKLTIQNLLNRCIQGEYRLQLGKQIIIKKLRKAKDYNSYNSRFNHITTASHFEGTIEKYLKNIQAMNKRTAYEYYLR
jgi:hypothetical protein